MGQAFGAGTTDALFGAGSGNALTKMTKYATAIFFLLTLSLSILNAQQSKLKKSRFEEELQQAAKQMDLQTPTTATNAAIATINTPKPAAATNAALLLSTNTLAPKAPATPPTAPAPDKAK
jgi:preprotein translocase subunit SecG